jgi:hypothetical protein
MDHPIIVNAFENARERNKMQEPKIYIICKRADIFYKDTYCILMGTWSEVNAAIQNAYKVVAEEKQEYGFNRGDHNELLDTPFDTWCCNECTISAKCDDITKCDYITKCDDITKCEDKTAVKCGSHWTFSEYTSQAELEAYLGDIKPGNYSNYCIEYM